MEEQTLGVYIPAVSQELANLLTDFGFSDAAEKVSTSSTPQALTDYCEAFIQSLLAPRIGRSWAQRTQNFLTTLAEDKLIKQMQDVLRAHDLTLEYFKVKVINSLGHMGRVGEILVERAPAELLSPFVNEADFITLISVIINEHGENDDSKAKFVELVHLAAEHFKEKEVQTKTEVKAEEKKSTLSLGELIEKLMPRGLIKRKLTEEEELAILKPIEIDPSVPFVWPVTEQSERKATVTASMEINEETTRVELLPARPQVESETSAKEIPAAPLFDKVWSIFNKKKKAEETKEVIVEEPEVIVAPETKLSEPDVIVTFTNNGGPSLLSRLNTFTASVKSAAESAASAVGSAVNSLVAPKSSIRLPMDVDAFIQGQTTQRELLDRMEWMVNEVRRGSEFLASAIAQHTDYLENQVASKLRVLSKKEKKIQESLINQLSFYETARDENDDVQKNVAVEKAATRWWNAGLLKFLPVVSYFYGKMKEKTADYFESALASDQIAMELMSGNKDGFNSHAEYYRKLFGDYIGERFDKFFLKNEDRNRSSAVLNQLEEEYREKYGEIPYKNKPLDLDHINGPSVSRISPEVIEQASQHWGDLAAEAPAAVASSGAPSLRVN